MDFPSFDTQDAIPESFRPLYVEQGGKWVVKPAGEELGEKGKEAVRREREARRAEKERADAAERERDELRTAAEAHQKGVTRETLDQIAADAEKKYKPALEENATLKAQLALRDRKDVLRKAGVMEHRIDKALTLLGPHIGADNVLKDKDGHPITATLEEFVAKEFKEDNLFLYSGSGASGSDASGSTGGAGGSSYDPVAAGKAAAEAQRKAREETSVAFQ